MLKIKDNSTLVVPIYHVDTVKRNQYFCNNSPILNDHSEEGNWAGNGMYFWDNYSSAKYWIRLKRKHNKNKEFNIVKATLCMDTVYLLDLTDVNCIKTFERQLNQLINIIPFPSGFTITHLGSEINLYHKALTDVKSTKLFRVVKLIGMYPKSRNVIHFKTRNKMPHVTNKVKTIYSILDGKSIVHRTIMEG